MIFTVPRRLWSLVHCSHAKAPLSTLVRRRFPQRHMSSLSLRPTAESQNQWFDVLRTSASSVRSVVIDTHPEPYWTSHRQQNWDTPNAPHRVELTDEYYRVLQSLSRFPNINELALRFTSDCVASGSWYELAILEDHKRRIEILDAFFNAAAGLCRTPRAERLTTLTIRNLQNTTLEEITSSDNFRETLKNITALHLQICAEWNEDHVYNLPDLQTFWPHLRSRWLEPLANQLETLSLYWNIHWGLYPPMDLRGLHFPRLRSLSLGSYVFGLDEQLEWLLSHKKLQHLSLDACGICSEWVVPGPIDDWPYVNVPRPDKEFHWVKSRLPYKGLFIPEDPTDGDMIYAYDGRWSTYFARFANELPELRQFQMGNKWDPWGDNVMSCRYQRDTRFEDRRFLGAELDSRYLSFWPGNGAYEPSPPPGSCVSEEARINLQEEERASLDNLASLLRERENRRLLSERENRRFILTEREDRHSGHA